MKSIFILIVLVLISAHSEELSLKRAQELLFQNNFDIIIQSKEIEKAQGSINEAHSAWYPSIDFYSNYNYLTKKSELQYPPAFGSMLPALREPISLGNKYKVEFGVDLTYPLFTGFSRSHNDNIKRLSKEAAVNTLLSTRNRAAYQLGILYSRWIFSFKLQEVRQKHLQYLQEYLERTKLLASSGIVASVNVAESQARFQAAVVEVLEAKQLTDSLTRQLSGLIQLEATSIEPQHSAILIDSISIPRIIDSMRSELVVLNSNKEQLEQSQKLIKSRKLPNIGALAGYRLANPGINMGGDEFMSYFIFGVQLKWNIFDGLKNSAQRFQLLNQIQQIELEKEKNIDFWNRALSNYNTEYNNSLEKIEAAKVSVIAAQELVDALKASLDAGIVSSIDHLSALNSLYQAEFKLEQAILNKRLTVINALYASGTNIIY